MTVPEAQRDPGKSFGVLSTKLLINKTRAVRDAFIRDLFKNWERHETEGVRITEIIIDGDD